MTKMLYVAHHAEPSVKLSTRQHITHVQVGKSLTDNVFPSLSVSDAQYIDNISNKNNLYSELTLQYDIWKNSRIDYVGLAHYRRHFNTFGIDRLVDDCIIDGYGYEYGKESRPNTLFTQEVFDKVVSDESIEHLYNLAKNVNTLVTLTPFAKTNRYSLFTLADIGWLPVRTVIEFFEYCKLSMYSHEFRTFSEIINNNKLHYCNNMIFCNKQMFDTYSEWLFNLLFGFEEHLRQVEKTTNRQLIVPRMFGYFSEYMLRPWCELNNINVEHVESICFENLKTDTRI